MKSLITNFTRQKRYERDFLNWDNSFFETNTKYMPKYHISPHKGLINDPSGIIKNENCFYILFQHHPKYTTHGLKTLSLATTKDFVNFSYNFMVNKPDNDFDSHGIYTGSLFRKDNKIYSFYSGNKREIDWQRKPTIIKSEFDFKNFKTINKEILIDKNNYQEYTEHFRDSFVFEYNDKYYLIIGAQKINLTGVILLFELDNNLENPKLIKEIFVSNKFKMIECPNLFFINDKAFFIYCGQAKKDEQNINSDCVYYSTIETTKLFDNYKMVELQNYNILDYGFEFYAPQVFKENNKYYLIAWCGIPSSDNYLEKQYGWVHTLTTVREIKNDNNSLYLNLIELYKKTINNNQSNLIKSYKNKMCTNQSITIKDNQKTKLEIIKFKDYIRIYRYDASSYYPYKPYVDIPNFNNLSNIEIYIDNSICELIIDNTSFTCRLYFDNEVCFDIQNNPESKNYIVFDIGGTYIKWSIINANYETLIADKFAFDAINRDCKKELIFEINNLIEKYINTYNIKGIGISTAGDVDINNTIIGSTPNHKNYAFTNFNELIRDKFNIDMIVDNDANCAVYGEFIKGELKNCESGVLLTLGTDIGGGIILNSQLYKGFSNTAGEIGYLNINGLRYGTWFSAIGLSRLVKKTYNIDLKPEEILNKYNRFSKIIEFWYKGLSIGIANIIALLNPQKIIIGGGLSESKLIDINKIIDNVKPILNQPHLLKETKIVLSTNGNKSALYGCVALLNKHYNIKI